MNVGVILLIRVEDYGEQKVLEEFDHFMYEWHCDKCSWWVQSASYKCKHEHLLNKHGIETFYEPPLEHQTMEQFYKGKIEDDTVY